MEGRDYIILKSGKPTNLRFVEAYFEFRTETKMSGLVDATALASRVPIFFNSFRINFSGISHVIGLLTASQMGIDDQDLFNAYPNTVPRLARQDLAGSGTSIL